MLFPGQGLCLQSCHSSHALLPGARVTSSSCLDWVSLVWDRERADAEMSTEAVDDQGCRGQIRYEREQHEAVEVQELHRVREQRRSGEGRIVR